MADFYTQTKLAEALASHKQAVHGMQSAIQQVGALGIRSVQLWQVAAAIDPEGAQDAGIAFATDAAAAWAANKSSIVAGLDAVAAGMGMTRTQLLADIAEAPATSFE